MTPRSLRSRCRDNPRWFSPPGYGLKPFVDIFTPRQLVALTTFPIWSARRGRRCWRTRAPPACPMTALRSTKAAPAHRLRRRGRDVSWRLRGSSCRLTDIVNLRLGTVERASCIRSTFGTPSNPYDLGFWRRQSILRVLRGLVGRISGTGSLHVVALPTSATALVKSSISTPRRTAFRASDRISTDPPYYDNIGYADLSDFFYVWLRRSLEGSGPIFPALDDAESGRTGRDAVPSRRQGRSRSVLYARHGRGA